MIVKEIDGRLTGCVSCVSRKAITSQAVINGRLVTEFRAEVELGDPAGTLVCEPVTDDERREFYQRWPDGDIQDDTVTRFDVLFHDRGVFTPRAS